MKTGDQFHLEMAAALRQYVARLKTWIHAMEADLLNQPQDVPADTQRHS